MRFFTCILLFICTYFIGQTYSIAEEKQWEWPVEGSISDYFGTRNGKHYGIDIAAEVGTPIVAIQDGIVTKSYFSNSYGHVVFIKHGEYEAVYAHMSKRHVQEGERVLKGSMIGEVGNTGRSYGAHLHLEIHKGRWTLEKKHAINPLFVMEERRHEAASTTVYIVQAGDTLYSIAHQFGMTVSELMMKNHLQKDSIYPSQKLYIN